MTVNFPIIAPKEYTANLKFRLMLLEKAERDPVLQMLIKRKCANGIDGYEFFCDAFAWTFDPRESNPHKPFILWPKQKENAVWLEDCYDRSQHGEKVNGVEDKPRAVGATVNFVTWAFWHYCFHEFSARIGSRKEDFVDKKGDPDTLFAKFDYLIERIPKWLIGEHSRTYMMLAHKDGNSTNSIVGESANPNFGRGGRKSLAAFDELGFWDYAKSSWESAGEATNFRLALSTPPESGHDSHYFKLLTGEAGRVDKFNFDWSDVPGRDAKWLEEAKATKSDEEFAREILKSYDGTTKGKVYAVSMRTIRKAAPEYHPELPLFISWDFGLDSVAMIWWQKNFNSNEVFMIDCYSNLNKEIDFYVPFVTGEFVSCGTNGAKRPFTEDDYKDFELDIIARHAGWRKDATHFGDPDVSKRNLINKDSVKDHLYSEHKIYVEAKPWGGRTWNDHKELTKLLFRRLIVNEERCEPVLSALRQAKFPELSENSQRVNEATLPIHDWTSHYRSNVEYFADNEPMGLMVKTRTASVDLVPQKKLITAEDIDKKAEEMLQDAPIRVKTIVANVSKLSRVGTRRIL